MGHNIYSVQSKNYFSYAEKAEEMAYSGEWVGDVPTKVGPGRPKEKRPIKRKAKQSKRSDYLNALTKMVKKRKWSAFCTATFDRRFKTPYSIYEHKVLKEEYLCYLEDQNWEPTQWEPTIETCHRMMEALNSALTTYSHKKWRIFYVIEEHKSGVPHIHFLLGNSRWGRGDIKKVS